MAAVPLNINTYIHRTRAELGYTPFEYWRGPKRVIPRSVRRLSSVELINQLGEAQRRESLVMPGVRGPTQPKLHHDDDDDIIRRLPPAVARRGSDRTTSDVDDRISAVSPRTAQPLPPLLEEKQAMANTLSFPLADDENPALRGGGGWTRLEEKRRRRRSSVLLTRGPLATRRRIWLLMAVIAIVVVTAGISVPFILWGEQFFAADSRFGPKVS